MKLMHYFLSGMLCLGLVAGSSFSAEATEQEAAEQEAFTLGEIVVTGEKSDIADIGISETITFEQIEATNSKTVAEALRFTPGITMTRGMKNEPEICVHGFGQEKSLLLIDGIPYYETYYGKLSLDQIPVGIISRIEITKNAPSVLYGANAQVAVINVITRQGTEKPSFSLKGELGEHDTFSTELSHGNQVGAVNYWLSYFHEESDGWRLSDDFEPETATRTNKKWMPDKDGIHEDGGLRKNSDYEKDRFWARAGIMPSSGSEYFVSFHIMDSEFGHPPATNEYKIFSTRGDDAGFSTFSRFKEYRDWGIDLSGKQAVSDQLTFRGKFFYHDHEDEYVSYDGPDYETEISTSSYKDNFFGGSLFADFSAAEPHMGHLSFHYRRDSHDDRSGEALPFNEYASYTGSVGTEHEYLIDSGLSLYAGISYDWFNVDDAEEYKEFDDNDLFVGQEDKETPDTMDELNPMIGFTWDLDQTQVYGSVARKTRFPALFELYSSKGGNPELSAEKTINYTLGVTRMFGDRVTADVSGFYHDVSDWISRDYYEDDYTGVELYDNVEDVSMLGFETSLDIVFCEYFKINANYTYIDAENKSDKRVTDRVIGVPENQFGVGFNALIPEILVMVDVQGIYAEGVYDTLPTTDNPDDEVVETDDYFTMNARISRTFKEKYNVYAEVDNLFDQDYEEEIGFPGRGRNFRVGASLSF